MKMKNIFTKTYLIIILLALFSISCSDDDNEVFIETPSGRVNDRVEELSSLLLSQANNGYKAVYFTKNDERGGFTIFMQFNADGTVRQTSDFDGDIDLANSNYDVRLGTTVELIFTTRNHITKGTDPETVVDIINGSPAPQGFYGTSVFQYFSNDNGVLTFRDIRNRGTATLVLTPTNFSDFDTESMNAVSEIRNQISNIAIPSTVTTPINHVLEINNTFGIKRYQFSYDEVKRYSSAIGFSETEIDEFGFGVAYTEEGLTISPALEFEGETYVDFLYDSNSNSYVSNVNGTVATILYDAAPAFLNPNDIIELEELGPTGFLYRRSLGDNSLTSTNHDQLMDTVELGVQSLVGPAWELTGYQLIIDFESDACDTFLVLQLSPDGGGSTTNVFYCFERGVITDGNLFLTYLGPTDFPFLEPAVLPLINFLANDSGLEFTRQGSFSTNSASFSNLAGTFRSLNEPSIRVYGLFFG